MLNDLAEAHEGVGREKSAAFSTDMSGAGYWKAVVPVDDGRWAA